MSFATLSLEELRKRHGNKWNRFDDDVIPCWVADMDFPLAPPIRDVIQDALARHEFGYPMKANGIADAFVQRMQERFDWSPDPAGVVELTDVVQGFYIAFDRLTEPGDGIVVNTPLYPPILMGVGDTGRRLLTNPLLPMEQGWGLDVEGLKKLIDAKTRMIVLCNPHNPSGRVFTRTELEAIAEIVEEHDLTVVSDEIHADLIYPGAKHIPFASISPAMAARTVTFTSATKAFNTAGFRYAVGHFGSPELLQRFQSLLPRFRGGLVAYGAEITKVAWQQGQPWLDEALTYLQGNRDLIAKTVAERMPGVKFSSPQSTYLAWLDFTEVGLNRDPHEFFLDKARVGLSEGPTFGIEGEGCTRLNFATNREIVEEILQRMIKALP